MKHSIGFKESNCPGLVRRRKGRMILLHGFIKKTQKTPQRELEVAKDRLLDPENTSITLATLVRSTAAVGKKMVISFEDDPQAAVA